MKFYNAILDFFQEKNIKTVFSYPGEQILPLYNALNESSDIKNIMVRHEQAAAHAADGYSRITNYLGVCLATAGPGATNLTTGIATAYKDSSSVIYITGRCNRKYLDKNYFQEMPMDFLNIYKGYFIDSGDINYFEKAFSETLDSKKPIHLNIPADVLNSNLENYNISHRNSIHENIDDDKDSTYQHIIKTKNINKPLLLIGQGIYGKLSYKEMLKINEILKNSTIPIATTYPARGVIDENNEKCLGLVGRRGTYLANNYLLECDAIFSIGASFSYNTIPESIRDRIFPKIIDLKVKINNINEINVLMEELNSLDYNVNETTSKELKIDDKAKNYKNIKLGDQNKVKGCEIEVLLDYSSKINEIIKNLPEDTIITTDAGNHTVFVSLLKKCVAPRNIISSHSMGTMGFGLPCAIGVKFGCLDYKIDREVVSINGDGGFQMNMQELATISENNLKILIIVMKNNRLNVFGDIKNPDFNKIADAYGIDNVYIENIEDIGENVKYYLKNSKPYLMVIECENEKLPKPVFLDV
jgi:acetolactate synthase-1/2/3 large subunit